MKYRNQKAFACVLGESLVGHAMKHQTLSMQMIFLMHHNQEIIMLNYLSKQTKMINVIYYYNSGSSK